MTINIFVFIHSTSLDKYSHSSAILGFNKLDNPKVISISNWYKSDLNNS